MNFNFLSSINEMSQLYKICTNAERFAISNPDISVGESRKAVEYIVRLLFGSVISDKDANLSLFEMLQNQDFIDYIDDRNLIDAIHFVRRNGNIAVHEGKIDEKIATECVEKIHFISGEVCIFLGFITSYPDFSFTFNSSDISTGYLSEEAIVISPDLIKVFTSRLQGVKSYSQGRKIVDVHKRTTNVDPNTKKVDSAANSKTAFYQFAENLAEKFGKENLAADYNKLILVIKNLDKDVIIAVKTGCSVLGTRQFNGEWNVLPGITHVLYAPDLSAEISLTKQLHVFTSDEFFEFWKDLELVRYKVSTAALRKYRELYGPDFKATSEEYGDNMSVQSFFNSKKKTTAVMEKIKNYPTLSDGGYEKIFK